MTLTAKQYISDVGLLFRYHPINLIDNSSEFSIYNYIPEEIKKNYIKFENPCRVTGLALRKVEITFIDLTTSSFDFLIPFYKEYYLSLITKIEIKTFSFIGEVKTNYRINQDLKFINND